MTIDRYEDIIDSREIEERISEIELEATGRWEAEYDPEGTGVSYGELADVDHYAYLDDEDAEDDGADEEDQGGDELHQGFRWQAALGI